MNPSSDPSAPPASPPARRRLVVLAVILGIVGAVAFGVVALLVTIFEHRQEARTPFVRVVEVHEGMTDPEPWGANWPRQFDGYRRTADISRTTYGGSSAMPEQKLEAQPWLRRLYAGYAFSIDYRERRGHAHMLYDQEHTERVIKAPQSGSCLHCHASIIPTYRRIGLQLTGEPADAAALAHDFNWPAVMRGFEAAAGMTYVEAHREMLLTPDGTPKEDHPLPGGSSVTQATPAKLETNPRVAIDAHGALGEAHPVSCVDCHDPKTMQTRVTRPGFVQGIQALAASSEPVPHLPSIERWRQRGKGAPYDPNVDATRQELRSYTCAQCHVEYYCATKEPLFFPWANGLKVEQIEKTYDERKFPDGSPFMDFKHGETGAKTYKAQHPEFEMWSQGVHARSGVSCADCHMPYQREGAMKVSTHWVRSPLLNINNSCQTCHNIPENELQARVLTIQNRTHALMSRAASAMTDMLDTIMEAKAAGATDEQMAKAYEWQKKAAWRLDFVSSENSMGFHADQEAARILGESIDYSRQAMGEALRQRPAKPPTTEVKVIPIQGVTPRQPPGP